MVKISEQILFSFQRSCCLEQCLPTFFWPRYTLHLSFRHTKANDWNVVSSAFFSET